ncbi:ABC transporter substrate-binding protein [Chelatococcus reniformis]|uniref:ABC transporter substrate-binding protein n=1 Tax=Chelatococcus reniformis TaxID=1494448 RepID=UPI0035709BD9
MSRFPSLAARLTRRAAGAGAALLLATALAAPARAQTVPVRIGYIPIIGAAPVVVADKQGWLKDAGLAPAFTVFESGPNMIQALASGTIDVYVAGVAPLAVARSKGIDVKVVAATAIEEMTFVASPKLAPFFEGGKPAAEAFKAFKAATGKPARLATQPPGSVPETTLRHWLERVTKTDKADVEIVPMGIDATQQALLAGAVDGATIREPADTIVMERNPAIKLIALGGAMFPTQPGTVIGVSGAFLAKHPKAVQALVDANIRAIDFIKKDPAAAAPLIGTVLGKGIVSDETIKKALASPATKLEADPRVIIEPTRQMQAFQLSIGTLDKELPLDGLFDTTFYETAAKAR